MPSTLHEPYEQYSGAVAGQGVGWAEQAHQGGLFHTTPHMASRHDNSRQGDNWEEWLFHCTVWDKPLQSPPVPVNADQDLLAAEPVAARAQSTPESDSPQGAPQWRAPTVHGGGHSLTSRDNSQVSPVNFAKNGRPAKNVSRPVQRVSDKDSSETNWVRRDGRHEREPVRERVPAARHPQRGHRSGRDPGRRQLHRL